MLGSQVSLFEITDVANLSHWNLMIWHLWIAEDRIARMVCLLKLLYQIVVLCTTSADSRP